MKKFGHSVMAAALIAGLVGCAPAEKTESSLNIQRSEQATTVATVEAVRHPVGRMTYRLETTPVWVSVPGYRILTPEAADTMTLPAAYGIFRADLDALPGNGL